MYQVNGGYETIDLSNRIDMSHVCNDSYQVNTIWGDTDTWNGVVPTRECLTIVSILQNLPDDIGDMIGRRIVQRTICRKLNKIGRQLAWRFMGAGQAPSSSVLQAASQSFDDKVAYNIRANGNNDWLYFRPDSDGFQGSFSRNFQTITMEGKRFKNKMDQIKGRTKESVVKRKELREGILQTILDYILYGDHVKEKRTIWSATTHRRVRTRRNTNIRSVIRILNIKTLLTDKTVNLFIATHFPSWRRVSLCSEPALRPRCAYVI